MPKPGSADRDREVRKARRERRRERQAESAVEIASLRLGFVLRNDSEIRGQRERPLRAIASSAPIDLPVEFPNGAGDLS